MRKFTNPWYERAANDLKAEIKRAGLTYHDLVEKLNAIGVDETYRSVQGKLDRGSYSHAFFLQCMKAMGKKVSVE